MTNVIHESKVEYVQVMDQDGKVDEKLRPKEMSDEKLKEIYEEMILLRAYDEKMFALQRSGKSGTYAQVRGQEACQIGSVMPLEKQDWIAPSFREFGMFFARGVDRTMLMLSGKGDYRANEAAADDHNLPLCIPIGSQCLHAVGVAWAAKYQKKDECAITYIGDGGTSEGDFHEAMNMAGVYKLPVIFFVQNNQWALSTPRPKQTAAETIAQKGDGYGMPGIQVDGNDIMAVYKVTKEAVERAKKGEGPTLIEAMTFRMKDHTTSDDAKKYRDPKIVEEWIPKDPITRIEKYLKSKKMWDEKYGTEVEEKAQAEANETAAKVQEIPEPVPEDLFAHIFHNPPKDYEEQLQMLKEEWGDAQ